MEYLNVDSGGIIIMSKYKGHGRFKKTKFSVGKQAKQVLESIDTNNPFIQMFEEYSTELDDKHDRYEKIVKLSRDVTIESKRIIFLLHSTNTDIESKRDLVLQEAFDRLSNLYKTNFRDIALELKGQDHYLYHKAFTAGMQEFIEAFCFYHYIKNKSMPIWLHINNYFQYKEDEVSLLFTQYDFILGIADFTGELMRKCINVLSVGNVNECFKLCNFVRSIYTGFLGLHFWGNKELSKKSNVLRQSLAKMELVCYNIKIRGSEIPNHMLLSVIESNRIDDEIDEGYVL
ncbi:translin-associated protein X [Cylas formicarius]|uniref:translin-associated protein X n=1 Tax=Cylas formicarius TaxID=197179 RepID=UPI002958C619|nr:translin-associated protein X [Cylas formicarius]